MVSLKINMTDSKSKPKKRPFKLTKELTRLAKHDGWTQGDIASACRTQQSVVSAWQKGSKNGTEEQLKPLLDLYGHKLRRNSFKVYWGLKKDKELTIHNYLELEQTYHRVEGKVILSEVFFDQRKLHRKKYTPRARLVIHQQGSSKFLAVQQQHINCYIQNNQLGERHTYSTDGEMWISDTPRVLESIEELLQFISEYATLLTQSGISTDAIALPFLTRQALLHHGFTVEGIVEYTADW